MDNLHTLEINYNIALKKYTVALKNEIIRQMDFEVDSDEYDIIELVNFKSFPEELYNRYANIISTCNEDLEINNGYISIDTIGDESYPEVFLDLLNEKFSSGLKSAKLSHLDNSNLDECENFRGYLKWKVKITK